MRLLQDWICMQGSGTTPRVQACRDWMDFGAFSDATLWLEVRSVGNPPSGNVTLSYESSPTKDETLFRAVATMTLSKTTAPVVTKLRLADNPDVPLARFLRWKLTATQTGDWSVTFRVFAIGGRALTLNSFDAASLALSGWWRAPFTAAPWRASSSLGSSGFRDLVALGGVPAVGSAVNGFTPADFDGANDSMDAVFTVADFFTAGAGSAAALVNIDAINTSAAIGAGCFNNDAITTDLSSRVGLFLGGASSNEAQAFLWDGAEKGVGVTVTLSTWQFLQMRWDGVRIEIRLNGGSWNVTNAGSISGTTSAVIVGVANSGAFFDGKMLELLFAQSFLSTGNFDRIRGYLNARYALSV